MSAQRRRTVSPGVAALRRIEAAARRLGPDGAPAALAALASVAGPRGGVPPALRTAEQVRRLHEALCVLRAYPQDARVDRRVAALLAAFHRRPDLRAHAGRLVDSGIAGTAIHYRFYWPVAAWLVRRLPRRLRLDERQEDGFAERLASALPRLLTATELETPVDPAEDPLARLRVAAGRRVTDAEFLLGRIAALPGGHAAHEAVHDGLDPAYVVAPGRDGPARTTARLRGAAVTAPSSAPSRARPDVATELARPPRRVQALSTTEGTRLIDLAQEAMVTRARDLAAFGDADPRDVRLVDDGDGLRFAWLGVRPARRRLLHATYGGLMLRNAVPIGYLQVDVLLGNAALSFNLFETFRGIEAAHLFGRMLASVRRVFGATRYSIEPYQLGDGNEEGLESGAWWFYARLGFRPTGPALARAEREMARVARNPGARTSIATLRRLAAAHVFLAPRDDAPALPPPPWDVGRRLATRLARFGAADRERGLDRAEAAARRALRRGPGRDWSADERAAWRRLAPLVTLLEGVSGFTADERRAALAVIRAKGGRRETTFLRRLDAHPALARAIVRIARADGPAARGEAGQA